MKKVRKKNVNGRRGVNLRADKIRGNIVRQEMRSIWNLYKDYLQDKGYIDIEAVVADRCRNTKDILRFPHELTYVEFRTVSAQLEKLAEECLQERLRKGKQRFFISLLSGLLVFALAVFIAIENQ